MGHYTVYCDGSQNFKNISGGVGELRIDDPHGVGMVDVGTLYFNAATVPEGEVFDYNEKIAVYCHPAYRCV